MESLNAIWHLVVWNLELAKIFLDLDMQVYEANQQNQQRIIRTKGKRKKKEKTNPISVEYTFVRILVKCNIIM